MGDHFDLPLFKRRQRLIVYGKRIAPPDILCRILPDRLEPELDPDRLDPVHLFQKVQDISRQAVRTGGNRKDRDIRMADGFLIERPKPLCRRVGPRVCLEIGDILSVLYLFRNALFPAFDLLRNA